MWLATHDLASKFLTCFADKIYGISLKLVGSSVLNKFLRTNSVPPIMEHFQPTTLEEGRKLVLPNLIIRHDSYNSSKTVH